MTTNNTTAPAYASLCKEVTEAVSATAGVEGRWSTLGPKVAAFYGTRKKFEDSSAAFIKDAILPGFDYKGQKATAIMALDTGPRKGGKEYLEKIKAVPALESQWAQVKELQANVRARAATIFGLLRDKYAFPLTDAEKAARKRKAAKEVAQSVAAAGGGNITKIKGDLAVQCAKILAAMIGKLQKADGATFDVNATMRDLKSALTTVTSGKVLKATK